MQRGKNQAALTGHLVLSTLHTNDAPSTISRLMNMGIEPFLVATSVNLICAQRLVRRICSGCKEPLQILPQALIEAGYTPEESETMLFNMDAAARLATTRDTKAAWVCMK